MGTGSWEHLHLYGGQVFWRTDKMGRGILTLRQKWMLPKSRCLPAQAEDWSYLGSFLNLLLDLGFPSKSYRT